METDEMELDTIGDRKTALFVIISDTDDTFNFVVSILYTQLFNLLCDKADDEYGGRLPVHVRCLLDEFANIGQIPKFEKLIATIRSREISASIILQSQSQLKAIYKPLLHRLDGAQSRRLLVGPDVGRGRGSTSSRWDFGTKCPEVRKAGERHSTAPQQVTAPPARQAVSANQTEAPTKRSSPAGGPIFPRGKSPRRCWHG